MRHGGEWCGGIVGYRLVSLYEEVAFLAYHFHWPLTEILAMEHAERRQWVEQISSINRRISEATERGTS
ncbi:DUF6760 family protein [Streptomyces sp. WG-D5]